MKGYTELDRDVARLHPAVVRSAYRLFLDQHYSQAIFEAYKAVEIRVAAQSAIDESGRPLMAAALADDGPIQLAHESGQSADDEQEGFKLLFMGASQGIRNPKAHTFTRQPSAQRTVEYLSLASLMFRRLDDAIHIVVRNDRNTGQRVIEGVEAALPGSVQGRIEGTMVYPSSAVPAARIVLYGGPAMGNGQMLSTAQSTRPVPFVFDSVLPGWHRLIAYVKMQHQTLIGSLKGDDGSQPSLELHPGGLITNLVIEEWGDAKRAGLTYHSSEPPESMDPGYELID